MSPTARRRLHYVRIPVDVTRLVSLVIGCRDAAEPTPIPFAGRDVVVVVVGRDPASAASPSHG